ncbi:hypothetical protein SDJN02_09762, partial [Cucurbita argyrosperma subsp. argyrosperma]
AVKLELEKTEGARPSLLLGIPRGTTDVCQIRAPSTTGRVGLDQARDQPYPKYSPLQDKSMAVKGPYLAFVHCLLQYKERMYAHQDDCLSVRH